VDVLTEPQRRAGLAGVWEVFVVALGLGLTSFGGPIAHLGYFERTYVRRRGWLTPQAYAGLVGLCQMLPGPASSQVGFLIGHARAGWGGAAAAWLGFTLPSAVAMFLFALAAPHMTGSLAEAAIHGLKLAAVAVVAQAVWTMARRLTPDLPRALIAIAAGLFILMTGFAWAQLCVVLAGALIGAAFLRRHAESSTAPLTLAIGSRTAVAALAIFLALLLGALLLVEVRPRSLPVLAAAIWRAGALVFGGGHVVLPLLRAALVPQGWLTDGQFLAGYGAAQAVPGPLFTIAAFVGAAAAPAGSTWLLRAGWALIALAAIFLPGLLLAVAGAPLWAWVGRHRAAGGALVGVNAAVVGVLAAALYSPVWTSTVHVPLDVLIVVGAVALLVWAKAPPLLVVAASVAAALGMTWLAAGL
jgi:chromate transporter